jgi:ABC-type Fe3+/spermidine/putrescine transport system ATPase subunit
MALEFEGLEVRGLRHEIGLIRLEADFSLGRADRLVIRASSGAGKSTLLRLIAGLEPLDQGSLRLDGREITSVATPFRNIGMIFQETALFESLSVLENAAFGLRMRGATRRSRREQAMPWLKRVGLADRADDPVGPLSGGEKQRVAFVRALIWKPRLLLLDEPFSALDTELRLGLRRELLELLKGTPVPTILVTHDREDAEMLATRTASIAEFPGGSRRFRE